MPRGKTNRKTAKTETTAESYDHKQETTLPSDIGLQAQFRQKRDPKKYSYDSSLSTKVILEYQMKKLRTKW